MQSEQVAYYAGLFVKAARERVMIACADYDEAIRLRKRLYAFRDRLSDSPERDVKAALLAPVVKISVKKDGTLIAEPNMNKHPAVKEALADATRANNNSSNGPTRAEVPQSNRQHHADNIQGLSDEVLPRVRRAQRDT